MRGWLVGILLALAVLPSPARAATRCDERCLSAILDRYLAALAAHDPKSAPLTRDVRFSENDVMLRPGDGLWQTISAIDTTKELRFFDPQAEELGYVGVVEEHGLGAYIAARFKVRGGAIAEIETIVHRKEPGPGIDPKMFKPDAEFARLLSPSEKTPRARMIELANGYFSTLQLNDGKIFTIFDRDCRRLENGQPTAGSPTPGWPKLTGCAHQLELGELRRITAARDRTAFAIDESRGLILTRIFLDHAGVPAEYARTDGTMMSAAPHVVPQTWCALELFKVVSGKLYRIEAVMIGCPYKIPTPWKTVH